MLLLANMRIGFDGKRIFHNKRGLGNYAKTLLTALGKIHNEHDYFIYTPSVSKTAEKNTFWEKPPYHTRTPQSLIWKCFPRFWRGAGLVQCLQKDGLDVYHGLSQELPHGIETLSLRTVVTVHDLLCIRYPNNFSKIDAKIYEYKLKKACRSADKIIAVSKQTKKDIIDFLGVDASRIEVIYPACHAHFYKDYSKEIKNGVKKRYTLPSKYILYVGAFEKNKNVVSLVKAYKEYKQGKEEYSLVLVGKKNKYRDKIENYIKQNKLEKNVVFLEYVHSLDLPVIFQLASLFVFPSLFEGFGLPVAEALSAKVPVITSRNSSLLEVGGNAALYIQPEDTSALVAKMKDILNNTILQKDLISKGIKQAEKFHETKIVSKLMHEYKNLH